MKLLGRKACSSVEYSVFSSDAIRGGCCGAGCTSCASSGRAGYESCAGMLGRDLTRFNKIAIQGTPQMAVD